MEMDAKIVINSIKASCVDNFVFDNLSMDAKLFLEIIYLILFVLSM